MLADYLGVNVNRVVLRSDGASNVHIIGVNWPHHVFVNQDFKVIGAEQKAPKPDCRRRTSDYRKVFTCSPSRRPA